MCCAQREKESFVSTNERCFIAKTDNSNLYLFIPGKSDPYVILHLEQDNLGRDKSFGKRESSHKKDDLNPVYGETFTFENIPGLNNVVLNVTVRDDDVGHDEKLGDCKFKLEKLGLTETPMEVEAVVDHKGLGLIRKHAKIYLKLSYKATAM